MTLTPQTAQALLEAAKECVPNNWLDSLLTGKDVPPLPWNCPEIERLLNGVRARIAAIASAEHQLQEGKNG